ncbi:Transmembrane protein 151-like [Hondaea fermentalgiana]|uniref:Transmembrane protein 151-like n=1 Tax=Hondaea fermentalgiana TaxID=2315210 RepID=A0A2R5GPD6_9STRA|nr:Transmembrane protein 151-like [Hondaea fermentalgiana]|eukprot:GBG30191.1 Transmembrane protein 151-like [Hondaea fermentalgiana]
MKNEDANSVVVAQTMTDDEDATGVPVADVQGTLGADDIVYTPAGKAPISLLLTIGTIASGAYAFQDLLVANPDKNFWDRPSFYFAVGFLVLYFAEAFTFSSNGDSTLNAFFNKLSSDRTFGEHDYFVELRNTKPQLWMSIKCHHYERRTRTIINARDHEHTESYYEKVVTFRKTEEKVFESSRDRSGPAPQLADLDSGYFGVIVHLRRELLYHAAEPRQSLTLQGQAFRDTYRNRDACHIFKEGFKWPEMRKAVMLLDKDRTPGYASFGWYMFATCLLCSWPYRMILHRGLMEATFTIVSEIDMAPGAFPDMSDAAVASSVNDSQ